MRLEDFLSENTTLKTVAKDDLIFSEGAQAEAAYYVIEGRVDIFKESETGASVMATLGAGDIFGEMALLRYDEYTLSARANEAGDVKLYVITPEVLQGVIREAHPLVKAILDMLVERVHDVNEVLIDIDQASHL